MVCGSALMPLLLTLKTCSRERRDTVLGMETNWNPKNVKLTITSSHQGKRDTPTWL